jgi:hypothetical protein
MLRLLLLVVLLLTSPAIARKRRSRHKPVHSHARFKKGRPTAKGKRLRASANKGKVQVGGRILDKAHPLPANSEPIPAGAPPM